MGCLQISSHELVAIKHVENIMLALLASYVVTTPCNYRAADNLQGFMVFVCMCVDYCIIYSSTSNDVAACAYLLFASWRCWFISGLCDDLHNNIKIS